MDNTVLIFNDFSRSLNSFDLLGLTLAEGEPYVMDAHRNFSTVQKLEKYATAFLVAL